MYRVIFRFYGDLNELLAPRFRQRNLFAVIRSRSSIKDAVEAQGVPHPEVALLLRNGQPCGWDEIIADGDRITLYPLAQRLPLEVVSLVWSPPPRPLRFALDTHLGRLAAFLRILGFDILMHGDRTNGDDLVRTALKQDRVILTMHRKLLMRNEVRWGRIIRSPFPRQQVREVLDAFRCREEATPFSRCSVCNTPLEPAGDDFDPAIVPEKVRERFGKGTQPFRVCPGCGRIYWKGSHWERMREQIRGWGVRMDDADA